MKNYNHNAVEKKWQKEWEKKKPYKAINGSKKKKFYSLIEFPYPSGDGLHVGHPRPYIGMDVISRKKRFQGFNVLYPIGWDAFGLPTENYAIKTGKSPEYVTKKNTDNFKRQIKSLGISFDWDREINTTDPKYYKWTQWIFLKFFEKSLAYKKKMSINWCPKDKIGLANEEVINGCCERCGTEVEKKEKEQWMLAITKYADRLDKDLDLVDYLPQIKIQQRNWIGKSDGFKLNFSLKDFDEKIEVFTTRIDTLFGVTYLVLAPEHKLVEKFLSFAENKEEILNYLEKIKNKTEIDRTDVKKEKNGVEIKGIKAVNNINGKEIPIFIADYVLADYGTGALMAVPAHDERDFEFAKKYNLPIEQVVAREIVDKKYPPVLNQEFVERKTIHAIVFNPKNNKYLCLNWKKFPWTTFIVGGVEEGENLIESAKREVLEETGFKNLKFIKKTNFVVKTLYNAAHKKQNRIAFTTGVFFELLDEERKEISNEELEKHEIVWLDKNEITEEKMTCAELPVWLENFDKEEKPFMSKGVLINSGKFNGLNSEEAKDKIAKEIFAKKVNNYKLRDWIFSRQRYWGEPIPIINCQKCGFVPVPEKNLPVILPKVKNYKPTDTGESPLANIKNWINVKCPKCKGDAKRETDTMPNWAGSSWYYLRYLDPKNNTKFASEPALNYWKEVDWYNGGMEHTTLHLLYSRFWHKFLYDLKLVKTKEPYKKRTSHGLILASNGEKMSKSRGNVINPDDVVKTYGADTLRVYEMFMGPFEQSITWDTNSIIGCRRFLDKIWRLQEKIVNKNNNKEIDYLIHKTIQKVEEDIENMKFNTAISSLMILTNEMSKENSISRKNFENFLILLSPFAPHISEELWQIIGNKKSIYSSVWPKYDKSKIKKEMVKIVFQINGKTKKIFDINSGLEKEDVLEIIRNDDQINKMLLHKKEKKVIFIKDKILNLVV